MQVVSCAGRSRRHQFWHRRAVVDEGLFFDGFFHPVAFSLNDNGFSVMQESVKERRREGAVVVKDLGPVFEGPVGSDDEGAAFIPMADDLEEEIGAGLVDGQIAKLIQDEKIWFDILFQLVFQAAGGPGRGEGVDGIDGGGKEDRAPLETGVIPEGDRQVCLALM